MHIFDNSFTRDFATNRQHKQCYVRLLLPETSAELWENKNEKCEIEVYQESLFPSATVPKIQMF